MQLDDPRGSRPRFLQPNELGERGGQLYMRDAMCRIGLNRPVGGETGFLIAATQQMAHRLRIEGGKGPWVKRA